MSNFTTVYDRIRTELSTIFSGKTEIPIPEEIGQNNVNLLRDGYGLITSLATPGIFNEFKSTSSIHNFEIVLSRELKMLENDPEPRHVQIKALIEDLVSLRVSFLNNDQLTIYQSIQNITYEGMSEISYVNIDKNDIISASITFAVEITEDIEY
jgi:hypothetical protein